LNIEFNSKLYLNDYIINAYLGVYSLLLSLLLNNFSWLSLRYNKKVKCLIITETKHILKIEFDV
jgi:hypothetical protein